MKPEIEHKLNVRFALATEVRKAMNNCFLVNGLQRADLVELKRKSKFHFDEWYRLKAAHEYFFEKLKHFFL